EQQAFPWLSRDDPYASSVTERDAQRRWLCYMQLRREPRRQLLQLCQDFTRFRLERGVLTPHLHVSLLTGQDSGTGEAERLATLLAREQVDERALCEQHCPEPGLLPCRGRPCQSLGDGALVQQRQPEA